MAETSTKIRRVPISIDAWTPIVAPCACNYFFIQNEEGSAMQRCSDPDNSETWYQIPNSSSYTLIVARHGPPRFAPGDVVTYIKATAGSGPLIVEFIL